MAFYGKSQKRAMGGSYLWWTRSSMVINMPPFGSTQKGAHFHFRIQFPQGTWVNDTVANRTFQIPEFSEHLDKRVKELEPDLDDNKDTTVEPSAPGFGGERDSTLLGTTDELLSTDNRSGYLIFVYVMTLLGILQMILGGYRIMRRGRM